METLTTDQRIEAFAILGKYLQQFASGSENAELKWLNERYLEKTNELFDRAQSLNGWYTRREIERAIDSITPWLETSVLKDWVDQYETPSKERTIGLILAGNIPLVGFHDLLSVLVIGHKAIVKPSSEDGLLTTHLLALLKEIAPAFINSVQIVDRLNDADAVIATGSNNAHRYFEYYFGKLPHLFRKSRTSVAVLDGNESEEELSGLGKDIFSYYGLGCRSVSKLYVPVDYDLDRFFGAIFPHKDAIEHNKYANNYDYYRAIYLLNEQDIVENGFLLLKEDEGLFSPVGTLFYERYTSEDELRTKLQAMKDDLQCVVSRNDIPFGASQQPTLTDYADNADTMLFLSEL